MGMFDICVTVRVLKETSEMTSHIEMMVINWSEVSFSLQDFDQLPQLRTHFIPAALVLTLHTPRDRVNECILWPDSTTKEKQM